MTSGGGLVSNVDSRLQVDAGFRDQIRTMHASGTPLVDMVDALGLPMSPGMRALLAGLSPDVVGEIRQATLEMLDRGTNAMPLNCDVTEDAVDGGAAVAVSVAPENAQLTIVVRAQ